MAELQVVALIEAKPGSEAVVREGLQSLARATRDEEGCLVYDVAVSAASPTTFVTVERWRAQSDLDAHLNAPHLHEALAAVGDHLAAPPAIHPLELIG